MVAGKRPGEIGGHSLLAILLGKGAEMDAPVAHQVAQDMMAADFVAAIGRKRRAMRQEQQVSQPSPRAMTGPAIIATRTGRRFHTAIIIAYLGLSGLIARGPWTLRLA